MFSLVSPWPHNLGGPTTPQRVGGGVNNFHPIYLFNITIFCVFLTAMNFMLGNPLPVEKGPQQLLVTHLWKSQGGKEWKLLVSALLVPESSRKQAVFFSYRVHHEGHVTFCIYEYLCLYSLISYSINNSTSRGTFMPSQNYRRIKHISFPTSLMFPSTLLIPFLKQPAWPSKT